MFNSAAYKNKALAVNLMLNLNYFKIENVIFTDVDFALSRLIGDCGKGFIDVMLGCAANLLVYVACHNNQLSRHRINSLFTLDCYKT